MCCAIKQNFYRRHNIVRTVSRILPKGLRKQVYRFLQEEEAASLFCLDGTNGAWFSTVHGAGLSGIDSSRHCNATLSPTLSVDGMSHECSIAGENG
jgi:hypothetical protein